MKRILLVLATLVLPLAMIAQTIAPEVIACTGGFASNNGGSVSYTVGEMAMVQTFTGGGYIFTQGFQQPLETLTGLSEPKPDESGSLAVYPNPAANELYFDFRFSGPGKVSVALYNELGQKISSVYEARYDGDKTSGQTNVSDLSAGMYLLMISFTPDMEGKTHVLTRKVSIIN